MFTVNLGTIVAILKPIFHPCNILDTPPIWRIVHLVGGHGAADPGVVVADLGVDSRLVPLGAAIAPGHHTLQLTIAHHGATRVSLIGQR